MQAIDHFRQSSSFKVGLLFTGLMLIGIFFVTYFLVFASNQSLLKESEAAVRSETQRVLALYQANGRLSLQQHLDEKAASADNDYFYGLVSDDDRVLAGNLPYWPTADDDQPVAGLTLFALTHQSMPHASRSPRLGSEHYDLLASVTDLTDNTRLLVGRNVDDLEIAQWVAQTFGWLMILILLTISVISIWMAYYVVSRINRIADTTDRIVQTGMLSERLPVDSSWDDLSKLSLSLNTMLAQLEEMVLSVKSVSDNIAHDLRTPLTRLRSDVEKVENSEQRELLLREVDNILSMFSGLLRIADVEADKQRVAFSQNDLDEIVEDVVALYEPLAEQKHIALTSNVSPIRCYCDRDLIFQAFANVLDNAIKFTPANGAVSVALNPSSETVQFSVTDSGPGLSAEDKEKVTRRFFRADHSRNTAGHGLGMALVAAVVKLHGGELTFDDSTAGTGTGMVCQIELKSS